MAPTSQHEDDEAHLADASPAGQHAGVSSSVRAFLWKAFMFCMEIPPHLEKNMCVVWGRGFGLVVMPGNLDEC